MKQKFVLILKSLLFSVIFFILTSCLVQNPKSTPEAASPSIASLDIPNETIKYPEDWPDDLRLPNSFSLVDANSGTSVGGASQGWTAMYRLNDSVDEAESILRDHFTNSGWAVPAIEKKDNGGYVFLLEKGESNGFVVIETDTDKKNQSLIMATFFQ